MLFNDKNFIHQYLQSNLSNFDELALDLYRYQQKNNIILQDYVKYTNAKKAPKLLEELVFLPVHFFKTHEVKTGNYAEEVVFTSSTTSGNVPSKHYVENVTIYHQTYLKAFEYFYGKPDKYVFLCLLPSYLERAGSSLIVMAEGLIKASGQEEQGFYLYNFDELNKRLNQPLQAGKQFFLLGVTFALLDFAAQFPQVLQQTIVMETGGMKGRRQEQTREEVHAYLKQQFQLERVHSEYGMTELLSQAYALDNGRYQCPPWMKVVVTDLNDPFALMPSGRAGILNIIDLANIHSCAFLQTQDIGRINKDGTFEILGRVDFSESRGCNLMYT